MNKVYWECDECHYVDLSDNFAYIGQGEFQCPKCGSKYCHVNRVEASK